MTCHHCKGKGWVPGWPFPSICICCAGKGGLGPMPTQPAAPEPKESQP